MEPVTKEIMVICGGLAFVLVVIIGAIQTAEYVTVEQRLRCYQIHQSRSTLDVLALCKGVK